MLRRFTKIFHYFGNQISVPSETTPIYGGLCNHGDDCQCPGKNDRAKDVITPI